MKTIMKTTYALALSALLLAPLNLRAQAVQPASRATPEVAITYAWIHSNAPVGGCGCFSLNGGTASFALPIRNGSLSIAAQFADGYSSTPLNTNRSLNLSTYTAGLRYSPHPGHRLQPFAQTLIGVAHLNGSLASSSSSSIGNAGAAFATNLGGGLDLSLNRHFALRLVQAQYLVTTFDNSSNNHQNNIELGAGAVFHFSGR